MIVVQEKPSGWRGRMNHEDLGGDEGRTEPSLHGQRCAALHQLLLASLVGINYFDDNAFD